MIQCHAFTFSVKEDVFSTPTVDLEVVIINLISQIPMSIWLGDDKRIIVASTQNTMLTISNALSRVCAESSIGSMQVGFLMALTGVPVRELFGHVGYRWRTTG
jgi:hypothetical protein